MRLGLLGGTFDPIHMGHLILAECCREACQLDRVAFLPAGLPPHKRDRPLTAGKVRAEMVELAIAGHPRFSLDPRELRRSGPSFTVETLAELHEEQPDCELYFLVGDDSLADLPTWKEPGRILQLARLVSVNRGLGEAPNLEPLRQLFGSQVDQRIVPVSMPAIGISSRELRRRVAAGESIRYCVPRAVECYIEQHGLYREQAAPVA